MVEVEYKKGNPRAGTKHSNLRRELDGTSVFLGQHQAERHDADHGRPIEAESEALVLVRNWGIRKRHLREADDYIRR